MQTDFEQRIFMHGEALAAARKVARVAMGDLLGASEPPTGVADAYPFNAPAWRDTYPSHWRPMLERVIQYVYSEESIPQHLR